MSKDRGGRASVPRLLRAAFDHAKIGDEVKAWSFWETAIKRGYRGASATRRQLEKVINEWRRDNCLPPNPPRPD